MVRRLREAGAIVVGLTLLPEMAICGFTESATYGVTRNPWNPQRTPGRLQRRLRRRGRRRAGPDRLRRRRRRLDPDPRRLLRALRAEAAARPGLAGARPRRLERPRRRRLPQPLGARHRALARRRRRRLGGARGAAAAGAPLRRGGARRRPASCASPARRCAPRAAAPPTVSDDVKGAVADAAELLRSLGHEVAQRDPDWGRIGNNISRPLPPRRRRDGRTKCPTPSGSNAAPAASAGSASSCPTALYERAMERPRGRRRPRQRDLRPLRRAGDAGDGRHGAAGPALGGQGRALRPCSG